jgi:hypothetical protein
MLLGDNMKQSPLIQRLGRNNFDNVKATLKQANDQSSKNVKIKIDTPGLLKSIDFKAGFQPDSDFMNLVDQVLDEMELLEEAPPEIDSKPFPVLPVTGGSISHKLSSGSIVGHKLSSENDSVFSRQI